MFGLVALVRLAGAAVPNAIVEQVQWPAWVEHAGQRSPVTAGLVVQAHDRLMTGENARLVIRLADGSAVKLGERAELKIAALGARDGQMLEAGLDVAKGAFRFTTGLFRQILGRRQVQVRFPTVSIGIRGTDVWGRSDAQREMVLLLEGKIAVSRAAVRLDAPAIDRREDASALEQLQIVEPMRYVFSEHGAAFEERTASAAELAVWAAETEPVDTHPSGRAPGEQKTARAIIYGALTRSRAETLAGELRRRGYPADVTPFAAATVPGSPSRKRFAVSLSGLGSAAEGALIRTQLRDLMAREGTLPAGQ